MMTENEFLWLKHASSGCMLGSDLTNIPEGQSPEVAEIESLITQGFLKRANNKIRITDKGKNRLKNGIPP